MTKVKITETTKNIEHPLEDFFDISEGSTEIREFERESELVKPSDYDEKDAEIDDNYQEIFDRAMEGYEIMVEDMEDSDPRYKARMGEVSLQHLSVALNAAKNKAAIKQHKDKISNSPSSGLNGATASSLTIDRNELLRQLIEINAEKESKIIEIEPSSKED